jgi:DNA-binding response OmpR family regulator
LPQAKILMISGFSRSTRVDQLLAMGDVEFLGKPFSPKEILSRVDRMMAEVG